jgi:hypothetical protein
MKRMHVGEKAGQSDGGGHGSRLSADPIPAQVSELTFAHFIDTRPASHGYIEISMFKRF